MDDFRNTVDMLKTKTDGFRDFVWFLIFRMFPDLGVAKPPGQLTKKKTWLRPQLIGNPESLMFLNISSYAGGKADGRGEEDSKVGLGSYDMMR